MCFVGWCAREVCELIVCLVAAVFFELYAFIIPGINFYSCTRYKLLSDYNSSSSSDTGSEEV